MRRLGSYRDPYGAHQHKHYGADGTPYEHYHALSDASTFHFNTDAHLHDWRTYSDRHLERDGRLHERPSVRDA